MGRGSVLKASFMFAIVGVVASTSVAHALNPGAAAGPTAEQKIASQVKEMANHIARMEDQLAKLNHDLTALRDQHIQLQPASRDETPDAPDAKP